MIATSLAEILPGRVVSSASPFSNPCPAPTLAAVAAKYPHVLITVVQIAERSGAELALYLKDLCLDCEMLIISGVSCFGNLIERASRRGFHDPLSTQSWLTLTCFFGWRSDKTGPAGMPSEKLLISGSRPWGVPARR